MNQDLATRPETPRDLIVRTGERVDQMLAAGELSLPHGYAWRNALQGAWLWLQDATVQSGQDKGKALLSVVTQASVANALLSMIVQGLAVHRKQGYFIPYGATLAFQRSVFGTITVAQRSEGLQAITAEIIYDGDTFRYRIERGRKVDLEHTQTFEATKIGAITGAYAWLDFGDAARDRAEVMTIEDIHASWAQSRQSTYDTSPHRRFPAEMAKRTVVTRALKALVNAGTDNPTMLEAFNADGADAEVEGELEEIDVQTSAASDGGADRPWPAGEQDDDTESAAASIPWPAAALGVEPEPEPAPAPERAPAPAKPAAKRAPKPEPATEDLDALFPADPGF